MRLRLLSLALFCALAACDKKQTVTPVEEPGESTVETGALLRVDSSFAPQGGFMSVGGFPNVLGIYPAPSGKIYVTSTENTTYRGVPVGPVCRLNTDGSLDNSFDSRTAFAGGGGRVYDLQTLVDGHIAVVGDFRLADKQGSYSMGVLNPDGSLDPNFNRQFNGPAGKGLFAVVEDPSGRLLTGGEFTSLDGAASSKNLVAFKRDGSVDSTTKWPDVVGRVNDLKIFNGALWMAGAFTTVDGQTSTHIAVLNLDGSLKQPISILQNLRQDEGGAHILIPAPNNKMYIAGSFGYLRSGISVRNLARFNADGTLDGDFKYNNAIASEPNHQILSGGLTAAGNLVLGGMFPFPDGNIGMVKADGSIDKRMITSNGGTGNAGAAIKGIYIDAQKRIYLAGSFTQLEKKEGYNGVIRLVGGD